MNEVLPTATDDRLTENLTWGAVGLQVTDLERSVMFWTKALGLIVRDQDVSRAELGTIEKTLIVLHSGAKRAAMPAYTGMYHVAIGVRSQVEFSRILARLIHLRVQVAPTDHLMAKSLYLTDPDGLEIEITYETPSRFGHFGNLSKGLVMYDIEGRPHSGRGPLDVAAELSFAKGTDPMEAMAQDTYLAHLHFKVAGLEPALTWFEALGFQRHLTLDNWGFADMSSGLPNTHRLAMNIWSGPNRPSAPDDMARLLHYELIAHDPALLSRSKLDRKGDVLCGRDPMGVEFTLRAACN